MAFHCYKGEDRSYSFKYYTNHLDDWTNKPSHCALHRGRGQPGALHSAPAHLCEDQSLLTGGPASFLPSSQALRSTQQPGGPG